MSEVGDLAFVVDDGVLSESYTVERSTGVFALGGWQMSSVNVPGYGVVSVANAEDLEMVPEGDRATGSMVFHSQARIFITQMDQGYGNPDYGDHGFGGSVQRVSDILIWNRQRWRVLTCYQYPNRNFWKAIASRLGGM